MSAVAAVVVAIALGWIGGRASTAGERRRLEWNAGHDVLTELPNRAGFRAAARAALAARRWHAVLVVDLDGFKRVNDEHGHAAGDVVLVEVAAVLRRYVAELGGIVGRWGGDEFAVLLPVSGAGRIEATVEGFSSLLARSYAVAGTPGGQSIWVGATVGVALAGPGGAVDLDQLMELADSAMYAARRHRTRWSFHGAGACSDPAGLGAASREAADPAEHSGSPDGDQECAATARGVGAVCRPQPAPGQLAQPGRGHRVGRQLGSAAIRGVESVDQHHQRAR